MIEAAGRPCPVLGFAYPVIVAYLLHFACVFDRKFFRPTKIGEDIVSRSMPAWSPLHGISMITHTTDATHDGIEIWHFESNVIEIRIITETEH